METATNNSAVMEREENSSSLSFLVEKEILLSGIKIVERATAQKGLHAVLANILIEANEKNKINLYATDFDLTIITSIEAQVNGMGSITLPAKKLLDIVSRLNDGIINFELSSQRNNDNQMRQIKI